MRSHSKALFAVAALFAFLLVPSTALAGKQTQFAVPTGGLPGGIAVNNASGDVYVQIVAGDRVERYDKDGNLLGQFGAPGSGNGEFSFVQDEFRPAPVQLAIDQSDGSLYVPDPGNNRVQKFDADGSYLGQLGPVVPGSEEMFVPQGVAVNPNTGDVLVADTGSFSIIGNQRVLRFSATGAFEAAVVDESDFAGRSFLPHQISLDFAGGLYVLDAQQQIRRFTLAGTLDSSFGSQGVIGRDLGDHAIAPQFNFTPQGIGFDPVKGHLLALGNTSVDLGGMPQVFEIDGSGAFVEKHGLGIPGAGFGLTASGNGERYFATMQSTSEYLVLTDAGAPPSAVSIDLPSAVTDSEATYTGAVNPGGGFETSWHFEYSSDGGQTWESTAGGSAGNGTADVQVSETVSGLEPSQEYLVRLVATKASGAGSLTSSTLSFTTDAVPPVVEALEPGPVTSTTAWLGALVNPGNSPTDFYVEYSTDPGFTVSTSVPVSEDASAGAGSARIVANQFVKGLQPSTTYHYRVVATNEAGPVTGEIRSFTTKASDPPRPSSLPDGRVWEKVSPTSKAGAHINAGNFFNGGLTDERSQAAVGGDAVTFGSAGKFGGAEGAPAQSLYLASRGPAGGWSTEAINPPMDPVVGVIGGNMNYFKWFSADLSRGLVTTNAALNPGDPKDVYNLYLRDNDTGSYTTISDSDASTPKGSLSDIRWVSADEEHFLFQTSDSGIQFAESVLKERTSDGTVRSVSVLPDGTPVPGSLGSADQDDRMPGFNAVSADGSRAFFSTPNNAANEVVNLYVREDGTSTTPVSISERAGDDPEAPRTGDFLGASADGSVAFFRSPELLTDDTPDTGSPECLFESSAATRPDSICYLYRWDANAPVGERLTNLTLGDPQGVQVLGMVGMADDGKRIYFAAFGNLDGSGSPADPNLYVWREGDGVRFVARMVGGLPTGESDIALWARKPVTIGKEPNSEDNNESYRPARVTPDGRYIAFSTHVPQTGYDTNGKQAIYIYDSETGRTICVSCGSVEPKSKGDSWFISCASEDIAETRCEGNEYLARNFRADGQRLIFDSKDALVPTDTNGVTDVYEWQAGQLHLLSSGTSAFASRFVDASTDGDDVFFTTAQRLTPSDTDDLRDLYDARVGGVPEPNVTPPCVADECQGTPRPAPAFQTPSSSGFEGAGDPGQGRRRCAKAKVRRNGRCVKRKARKQAKRKARNRRANDNRRAGR